MGFVDQIAGYGNQTGAKAPVRLATTGNIALSGLPVIDGVQTRILDRVLVILQTNPVQNGIYEVGPNDWRRAVDFASNRDVREGGLIMVTDGNTMAGKIFAVSSPDDISINSSWITFNQISGYVAGDTIDGPPAGGNLAIDNRQHNQIIFCRATVQTNLVLNPLTQLGTACLVVRIGSGEVRAATTAPGTMRCRLDRTAEGQFHNAIDLVDGMMGLLVTGNPGGASAQWLLSGDTKVL